jgi:hypothetical protein
VRLKPVQTEIRVEVERDPELGYITVYVHDGPGHYLVILHGDSPTIVVQRREGQAEPFLRCSAEMWEQVAPLVAAALAAGGS